MVWGRSGLFEQVLYTNISLPHFRIKRDVGAGSLALAKEVENPLAACAFGLPSIVCDFSYIRSNCAVEVAIHWYRLLGLQLPA